MEVVSINKQIQKSDHDIKWKDRVFHLDVVPKKYGCAVLYYFDCSQQVGPFVTEHRHVVGQKKIRKRWFDKFLGLTLKKKAMSAVHVLKRDIMEELNRVNEADEIADALGVHADDE